MIPSGSPALYATRKMLLLSLKSSRKEDAGTRGDLGVE